jgi:tRNA (guanine9-N1)-methyltransferase
MSEQIQEDDVRGVDQHAAEETAPAAAPENRTAPSGDNNGEEEAPKMSKNALKRMRKAQEWEDGREDRAKRRKEKRYERRQRYSETRKAIIANAAATGQDPSSLLPVPPPSRNRRGVNNTLVPMALILDCDFETYMTDKELISLSSQVVRSYSDNRAAKYRAHLWIGGWKGKLFERFETAMRAAYKGWKGVEFCEGDFIQTSEEATAKMAAPEGRAGVLIDPLLKSRDHPVEWVRDEKDPFPLPDPEPEPKEEHKNIVYLTSESPYTLERLEPNTCYVIGGIVDKNREKGLCYRRARERGIRTAKLPIGKFMVMQSRQVLATNHVVEIMLKWLEFEDWGKAFTAVIPKRKGGTLRADEEHIEEEQGDNESGAEEEEDPSATKTAEEPVVKSETVEPVGLKQDVEDVKEVSEARS